MAPGPLYRAGMGQFAAILGVFALVIVTPGPDTALTIRNTLVGGRRAGIATGLGVVTGQAGWTLAASAGVAALIVASEPAFVALKLAGAAYLVYLGVQALATAVVPGRAERTMAEETTTRKLPRRAAYRQGIISDLSNPKAGAFFTSVLPQFAPEGGGAFFVMLALGLLMCTMTIIWLTAYATVLARAGDFMRRPRVRRTIEGIAGTALVALGLRLATEERP
jgi:threonine/homoserine/homoserine lactone efflux protein